MKERRVLVTGSSRGIGKAIAERLSSEGWLVALHGSADGDDLRDIASALGKQASGVYCADLSQTARATDLFQSVLRDGPVHAVVNNAGVYLPLNFIAAGDAAFTANLHRTFAVNFESPLAIMRLACRQFIRQGGGKILNVASRVGFKGEGGAALYAASKAAIISLTRSLAVELAPKKIGVFGLAPGWVDTAMAREGMDDRLPEILASIPLGRMATPEDVAAAAAFLLSDGAAYLSGVVIDVNGASYFH
ncbi:MAG: SDR family oxidoreductase [Fimbriimonas ginsengisoli]|uniref:SDR family oxidoreductase n=1 Tax=Fimbriimonas ginsengisoli TaxID=1005039 RepID=A0A931LR80_FIMGI|nr:SDR family oxidoreductase [Fimbriimonas ginsengisoli]